MPRCRRAGRTGRAAIARYDANELGDKHAALLIGFDHMYVQPQNNKKCFKKLIRKTTGKVIRLQREKDEC